MRKRSYLIILPVDTDRIGPSYCYAPELEYRSRASAISSIEFGATSTKRKIRLWSAAARTLNQEMCFGSGLLNSRIHT